MKTSNLTQRRTNHQNRFPSKVILDTWMNVRNLKFILTSTVTKDLRNHPVTSSFLLLPPLWHSLYLQQFGCLSKWTLCLDYQDHRQQHTLQQQSNTHSNNGTCFQSKESKVLLQWPLRRLSWVWQEHGSGHQKPRIVCLEPSWWSKGLGWFWLVCLFDQGNKGWLFGSWRRWRLVRRSSRAVLWKLPKIFCL